MTTSNWAVILCKFADDTTSTLPMEHYQRLFTGAGSGSFNMTDYFGDMSHGQLDLSGSQVFGWFTLSINKADYVGGKYNRNDLVGLCRQAAGNGGVPLNSFDAVVISMNGAVDLFGYVGGMEAFCDSNSLSPSPLGQEMGHGYGLDHARKEGSTADYQDPWDVMSVYAADMQPNADWGTIGPGLNAWSMRSQGWLDESRVYTFNGALSDEGVELRPLHRRDLGGYLAASLGEFLVEYRPKERWDAAFPRSAVFVHRFNDNHPYIMPGTNGNYDLVAGDVFQNGVPNLPFSSYSKVEVVTIDDARRTATLRLTYRPKQPIPNIVQVGTIFGGVAVDGGGWIFIDGQFHPVPPRGPENEILQQLANYLGLANIGEVSVRARAQQSVLGAMSKVIGARTVQLQPLRSPSPQRVAGADNRQSGT
jgi:hypothetical protein